MDDVMVTIRTFQRINRAGETDGDVSDEYHSDFTPSARATPQTNADWLSPKFLRAMKERRRASRLEEDSDKNRSDKTASLHEWVCSCRRQPDVRLRICAGKTLWPQKWRRQSRKKNDWWFCPHGNLWLMILTPNSNTWHLIEFTFGFWFFAPLPKLQLWVNHN